MKFTDYIDQEVARKLREVADLLYPSDDPRATPWPGPERLGRLRSHLRNLADSYAPGDKGGDAA